MFKYNFFVVGVLNIVNVDLMLIHQIKVLHLLLFIINVLYIKIKVVANAYGVHVCCVAIDLLNSDPLLESKSNPPKKKKKRWEWEINQMFSNVWIAKLPWAETMVGFNGKMHIW
jgi:hypothetical protein